MANLLIEAMRRTGHAVQLISCLRSFTRVPDDPVVTRNADCERQRILAVWRDTEPDERPNIWFTYHPYYRAPDLLGPQIARHARLPYVTAEASFASKRDHDAWAPFQLAVKDAVRQAAVNFCMTAIDREGLLRIVPDKQVCTLPPFIDVSAFEAIAQPLSEGPVRLVTTAMMRPGVKLDSYRILARVLSEIVELDWTLRIVGDGPERGTVEAFFASLPSGRITFCGELHRSGVVEQLRNSDLFVWPGIGEAYGLAYLEAQACGLPVCAMASQGVPSVVRDGVSGLLAPDEDVEQFTANLARLVADGDLRISVGKTARSFVRDERSIDVAAGILDQGLRQAVNQAT